MTTWVGNSIQKKTSQVKRVVIIILTMLSRGAIKVNTAELGSEPLGANPNSDGA